MMKTVNTKLGAAMAFALCAGLCGPLTTSASATDMVRPAQLANLETLKQMTIDQKIRFWRDVMQHAHDRGIEVYLFTWKKYASVATGQYQPQLLTRVGYVDLRALTAEVERDIEIAMKLR